MQVHGHQATVYRYDGSTTNYQFSGRSFSYSTPGGTYGYGNYNSGGAWSTWQNPARVDVLEQENRDLRTRIKTLFIEDVENRSHRATGYLAK